MDEGQEQEIKMTFDSELKKMTETIRQQVAQEWIQILKLLFLGKRIIFSVFSNINQFSVSITLVHCNKALIPYISVLI